MNIGRETEWIEFKKSTSETREGLISIASILNKHGKGELYFGVKDNGDVVGQDIGKDTERKLSGEIAANIRPAFRYEVMVKYADDGRAFIEVAFSGGLAPYAAYGRYYQRFADEDRQISDTELERLFKARRRDYSEWENAESDESMAEVDGVLLRKVIADGNESGRLQSGFTDAETVLGRLGLYHADTGRLTNAGKYLFSKTRPVLLKEAVYAGTERNTFIRLNHFEGNIFECIQESISFIISAINWNVSITGEARRKEEPEIPRVAVREMCVNAFAHGCYDASTAFSVEVFSDRVVIYSPGYFPPGYRPEDFACGAAEPIMMNPKIVGVLFRAAVIESFGTGYERTFAACGQAGVGTEYEDTLTGFRFVFLRPQTREKAPEMSRTEKVVYDLMKQEDSLTIREIAPMIDRSEKTVFRAISGLKEKGYLLREGSDNSGYWKIIR